MIYEVRFSQRAEDDLAEVLSYIVERAGEQVARRYVDTLVDYCMSFENFPHRGSRSDVRRGLRLVGFRRRATIAFIVRNNRVVIVRIFHRGRKVDLKDLPSQAD